MWSSSHLHLVPVVEPMVRSFLSLVRGSLRRPAIPTTSGSGVECSKCRENPCDSSELIRPQAHGRKHDDGFRALGQASQIVEPLARNAAEDSPRFSAMTAKARKLLPVPMKDTNKADAAKALAAGSASAKPNGTVA
jgi:hypothetical protein